MPLLSWISLPNGTSICSPPMRGVIVAMSVSAPPIVPAGMAASQLQRLGHLIGGPRHLDAARRTMARFAIEALRLPLGFAALMTALTECRSRPAPVLLSGLRAPTSAWRTGLAGRYLPGVTTLQPPAERADLPAMLARPTGAHPQAWVCRGPQGLAPITDIESLLKSLS